METAGQNAPGLREAFAHIEDPRRQGGNFRHLLLDILVIGLCSTATGSECFSEMEDFGNGREAWFRKFLTLKHGIPDADTFRRVFERLNPAQLMECLGAWLGGGESGGRTVNIDGKTLRGSARAGASGVHLVSAWVNECNLTLGQVATEEKSNEITAIPRLLDLIDIKGDTVTIDAMGCQTEIAAKIRSKKADYVLAVKENHPTLHEEISECFLHLDEEKCPHLPDDIWEGELEKDHGRLERRRVRTVSDIGFLTGLKKWKDAKTIVEYRCERTELPGGATAVTSRYYISSLDCSAEEFARIIRGHWSIENRLHWSLDVSFREDGCRSRKDNAPKCLAALRRLALGLLRATDFGRPMGLRRKMRMACIRPDFLTKVIFGG